MASQRRAVLGAALAIVLAGCTSTAPAPGTVPLSPGEVAMIARIANQGEVNEGEQARTRAASAAVRDFAGMMIAEHSAALQRVGEVAAAAGISPVESRVSREVAANSAAAIRSLGTWSGAEFDRHFMERQIAVHEFSLSTIDNMLLPNARERRLRTLLTGQRAAVAAHLQRARDIRAGL